MGLWLAMIALGAFHGINPAMGWLFTVALGLQEQRTRAVVRSLLPIALGHALSIGVVVAALVLLRVVVGIELLKATAAILIIGFGVYRLLGRHKTRVGMRVGFRDLLLWSFFMATAHGAGLILVPVLLQLPNEHAHAAAGHAHMMATSTAATSVLAVAVHTLAMLVTTAAIAIVVFRWVGLAFLRRGWINLDLLWVLALIGAGEILLVEVLL